MAPLLDQFSWIRIVAALSFIIWGAVSQEASTLPFKLTNEKKLIQHLLNRYPVRWGRPVNNMTEKVEVRFGLNLIQILDLDEKNQILQTNVWNRYNWYDVHLKWDPGNFGGLDSVRLPLDKIWSPDIVLYNYADTRLEEKRDVLAVVYADGSVNWIPPSIYKSTCSIDIAHFPYDEQECHMKFGSWTYDGYKVDLKFYDDYAGVDLSDYIPSNEWEITGAPAVRNEKRYSCCPEPYPDLTFYIRLRRKGGFYNYILVLPCVLLASLTMVLFWLPPESPAKVILGMNIFVAFFLLLLLLAGMLPQASENIPRIGAYYCINMILIATSSFLCVIVIHIYFRGDKRGRVPPWVRKVFLECLARFFCMLPPQPSSSPPTPNGMLAAAKKCDGEKFEKFELLKERFRNKRQQQQQLQQQQQQLQQSKPGAAFPGSVDNMPPELSLAFMSIENDVKEIRDYLRHMRKRLEDTEAKNKMWNEWRQVALVLDRTFFFFYLIANVVSLAIMFPRAASHDA